MSTAVATGETHEPPQYAPFVLSSNPKPATPRPSMTFAEQADLLEYLHGRMTRTPKGTVIVSVMFEVDAAQVDDLYLTAQRLRRMAPFESEIKQLVTGR